MFFVSYARPGRSRPVADSREPNRHVMRFFDELTESVNELIGSPLGQDPGYLDFGQGSGERWEDRVLRAIGTSQVLVCLLSRPFFLSSWCSREWDAFERRTVVPRAGVTRPGDTAIVPVLWTPYHEPLPPRIAKVNVFRPVGLPDESYAERYLADGLFGLLRTGQTEVYQAVVWKLALHIQRIHSLYWTEPGVPSGVAELRSSFDEAVP
ncbi:TIR-like protein FxsC [Paractinoplanes durhamensis]|uniref:TIR-like protein FxsC n=1 Tax=Paractinoplanes durhamensis TaxID=113563 RepID=UPI001EF30309